MTAPTRPFSRYKSGTPLIAVDDAAAALDFYLDAFDGRLEVRLDGPDGRVLHAAIQLYGAPIVVVDEMPEVGLYAPSHYGGSPFSILLDCPDADAAYYRAVNAGAQPLALVRDDFSGGRHGLLRCPFGHRWITASRTETLTIDEIRARFDATVVMRANDTTTAWVSDDPMMDRRS